MHRARTLLTPIAAACLAALSAASGLAAAPERLELKVDGTDRQALICAPAEPASGGAPLVFVFHGHGGNMQACARSWDLQSRWPEAIVIYPQGLPTASPRDPQGERPGWQRTAGVNEDRDLKLFDALVAAAKKKYRVDDTRIYAAGHSNGGVFTYLLWVKRSDVLAAIAPRAGPRVETAAAPAPLPVMHIAGRQDQVARFALQEATLAEVRKACHCAEQGEAWAPHCTLYPSTTGTPLVAYIHDGGHIVPNEAPPLVVRFFKEYHRSPSK